MDKKEIKSKIDMALQDVEMPNETRELLILLKGEISKAKSQEEYFQIGLKWFELITKFAHIVTTVSQM